MSKKKVYAVSLVTESGDHELYLEEASNPLEFFKIVKEKDSKKYDQLSYSYVLNFRILGAEGKSGRTKEEVEFEKLVEQYREESEDGKEE